ncbi:MAG TPA: [FeFe] hydrogenase H-cluster radical SAM maturase HydG [Syntrophothermus lipocalidus]|uniref:Biotin and thiamin synthesis associated n=1 Tax=Syntrophothermus lipocalidus (strain DSM 12680 / TGB-C1) TaxID=643648 RepID=D7CIQ5_SYNLT|nr:MULTISPECIES: [FeFe] hydrogenase H-cluster radical SAM maturase HydG [Syntrophothermus]ADI00920.1 biotin and thiamin synthesis associated [Syntrophothermus lipocalidus DSM 12680]NSW84149.1 [FeFe] hydrogenase H-cluster radical SAM maturase HydG [Syntrophothermus sp.]HHV77250.1 [FeFe] hydrogenase H-cluster radical SAM maturase HydG [Syntrophothermus lipocalidus]HOV43738.1 [FeFe] hydrogenase H-cluster radical SAM maturase HydG [Syntrophothermus lipocalidus]
MAYQAVDFINEEEIWSLLEAGKRFGQEDIRQMIEKAREAKGLEPVEVAALIQVEDPELLQEMYAAAREIKEKIYGKRLVFFAPLYISNYCINDCVYCGYHRSNKNLTRRKLTIDEIAEEVRILEQMGHKRIALETGEHPVECPIEYVVEAMQTIYSVREANGNIRRINVNIAATTVENYRKLKEAGIGTYVLFQETYHHETYAKMHPSGPKSDYLYHLTAMDRAMQGGCDDVGLGVLFGLFDYRFEVMGFLMHARHLDETFGVGPHTLSFPRLRPADGVSLDNFPYLVSDDDFRKIIAVMRMAVPYTGMILSTREAPGYRDELFELGISQISAGSCTGVGGYREEIEGKTCNTAQFEVADERGPDELIRSLCVSGYIPSYCTACYRSGRTGDRFMALAKTGQIGNVCQPNAILTFKEYLEDYASPETKEIGEKTIQEHLGYIKSDKVREKTIERLAMIEAGARDLYF